MCIGLCMVNWSVFQYSSWNKHKLFDYLCRINQHVYNIKYHNIIQSLRHTYVWASTADLISHVPYSPLMSTITFSSVVKINIDTSLILYTSDMQLQTFYCCQELLKYTSDMQLQTFYCCQELPKYYQTWIVADCFWI